YGRHGRHDVIFGYAKLHLRRSEQGEPRFSPYPSPSCASVSTAQKETPRFGGVFAFGGRSGRGTAGLLRGGGKAAGAGDFSGYLLPELISPVAGNLPKPNGEQRFESTEARLRKTYGEPVPERGNCSTKQVSFPDLSGACCGSLVILSAYE